MVCINIFLKTEEVIESCEVVRTLTEVNDNKENTERTVKCTCKAGKMAGTRREQPACVPSKLMISFELYFILKAVAHCHLSARTQNCGIPILTPSAWFTPSLVMLFSMF